MRLRIEFRKLRKMLWHPILLKKMIKEETAEEKEMKSIKLNFMCFNIPESKRSDVKERQNEDKDFLINLLDTKLNYSLGEEDIIKPVLLEKRSESMDQSYKCRPLRFSVRSFQVKRELFKASMSLRENDEMFSNIYFTPDLLNARELKLLNFVKSDVTKQMNCMNQI